METAGSKVPDIDSEDMMRLIEAQDRRDTELAQQAAVFEYAPDEVKAEMLKDPALVEYLGYRHTWQHNAEAQIKAQEDDGLFYV